MNRPLVIAGFALLCAAGIEAQAKPRIAGIARPPARDTAVAAPAVVQASVVPVLVTSDGKMYVNFGSGYEQVIRGCGASAQGALPPVVRNQPFNASLLPAASTQPIPTISASPRLEPAKPIPTTNATTPTSQVTVASTACWVTDPRGAIAIVR